MQGIFEEPLVWLALEILLPVVPAFLLFSALPSTGEAMGTFQGMHFKFGGAFAGYFGLLVLLFSFGPKEFAASMGEHLPFPGNLHASFLAAKDVDERRPQSLYF